MQTSTLRRHVLNGLLDACSWPSALVTFYASTTIQIATTKVVATNVVLLLGSWLALRLGAGPHLLSQSSTTALSAILQGDDDPDAVQTTYAASTAHIQALFNSIRQILRIFSVYPVYLAFYFLNAYWFQQIANRAYTHIYGTPAPPPAMTYDRFLKRVADESYRHLVLSPMHIFSAAVVASAVPVVGWCVAFALVDWMVADVFFQYKWRARGWTLEKRVEFFEGRWAYFLGFGLPCTIFIFVLPPLLGACLFGTLYPFYIIMATRASPTPRLNRPAAAPESLKEKDENGGVWPYRIPVFALSLFLSNHVVRFLCGRRRKGRVA